jgi:hypothetical protein
MELRPHQEIALSELRNGSEEWVEVLDFPDYLVSNCGRVYSIKHDLILTPYVNHYFGYERVSLYSNNERYRKFVHRLVAESFVPGFDYGLDVNHIDGNKRNNYEENLEWVTRRENIQHAWRTGLSQSGKAKKVIVVETGDVFNSVNACSDYLGFHRNRIGEVLSGKRNNWKGYTFNYVE